MSVPAPLPARIAILAYPGAQTSAVLGLIDLFALAARFAAEDGAPPLQVEALDWPAGAAPPDRPGLSAVILPPSLDGARGEGAAAAHAWLRGRRAEGALMCSVCVGAFWLGHAGLLDGRVATTHWAAERDFRAAFPRARLDADRMLAEDAGVITAGGLMAWLDLGLRLVERFCGPRVAARTGRHLLVDVAGREQRHYRGFVAAFGHGDAAILALQREIEAEPAADHSAPALARRAGMSPRTLLRRFAAATGHPPGRYLQLARIEAARAMLETTRLSVAEIAWRAGWADASAFGRAFRAAGGVAPGEHRRRFGASGGAEPGPRED